MSAVLPVAAPNEDWVALARDAYTGSTTYFDASIRAQMEADIRQFQGQHPAASKYNNDAYRGRSKLFRPKTRAVIRKNEAAAAEAFFSSDGVVSVGAEDDNDPVQQASAAVMKELLQYRLTKSLPWFQLVMGAYQDAQTVGVVCSYQYWEYNQRKGIDRPAIRLVPVENLRFDPGANWTDPVNTSPYWIELIPMYVKDIKARMRSPDPKTGEPRWHAMDDSVILQATRGYTDSIRQQREGQGRTDSTSQTQAYSPFNIVWVHKNIIEVDGVDYCYYTLGCEQLLSDPVPLEQQYFHGKRPYVLGCAVIETHKLYPSSVPRLTKDVQAEINEIANQRIDNVKLVLNKRYFAKRNKQVDLRSITRNIPGSVTLMQDIDDVKPVEFKDVTASSYKEQEVLNLDFDDVAGSFSGSSVQSNRKLNETVGGMQMLDASANQVSGYQLRTFVQTWAEPVLRQIVLLEQYYETDETILMLCGQRAQIAQKFGVDAVTDAMLMGEFTLNVNVGVGATTPSQQIDKFINAMASLRAILEDGNLVKYGLVVEEVIKELFGKLGYKDGGRFFNLGEQDPQVMQLQATISELQAALDAKVPKELVDAQVRQIEAEIASLAVRDKKDSALAVKTGVEASFSAMQGAEVIAAVPQVAPIADELMRSAGYQEPTPAGIDPNYPQPGQSAPGIGRKDVWNRKTGLTFTPGVATPGVPGDPSTTLDAMNPATPGIGVRQGIETTRPDSVGPGAIAAYVNGGLLDTDGNALPPDGRFKPVNTGFSPPAQNAGNPLAVRVSGVQPGMSAFDVGHALHERSSALVEAGSMSAEQGGAVAEQARELANPGYSASQGAAPLDGIFSRFADGGQIVGPGTGTSDSIAATVQGQPLAVSNGEYVVPKAVVDALGQDFFEALLTRLHTPATGANGPLPVTANPLRLEDGSFIIPADVVAQLGRDFFDTLVQQYGGQP